MTLVDERSRPTRFHLKDEAAMQDAPASAIQELAGYRELATTQRYMLLSHAAIEKRGNSVATAPATVANSQN